MLIGILIGARIIFSLLVGGYAIYKLQTEGTAGYIGMLMAAIVPELAAIGFLLAGMLYLRDRAHNAILKRIK